VKSLLILDNRPSVCVCVCVSQSYRENKCNPKMIKDVTIGIKYSHLSYNV